jgi:hypothetical protein
MRNLSKSVSKQCGPEQISSQRVFQSQNSSENMLMEIKNSFMPQTVFDDLLKPRHRLRSADKYDGFG